MIFVHWTIQTRNANNFSRYTAKLYAIRAYSSVCLEWLALNEIIAPTLSKCYFFISYNRIRSSWHSSSQAFVFCTTCVLISTTHHFCLLDTNSNSILQSLSLLINNATTRCSPKLNNKFYIFTQCLHMM